MSVCRRPRPWAAATTTSKDLYLYFYLGLPSSLAPRGVDQCLEGRGVRLKEADELLSQGSVRVRLPRRQIQRRLRRRPRRLEDAHGR